MEVVSDLGLGNGVSQTGKGFADVQAWYMSGDHRFSGGMLGKAGKGSSGLITKGLKVKFKGLGL